MKMRLLAVLLFAGLTSAALPLAAQQAGGGGAGGGGGGWRNMTPEQIRERMQTRIKEALGANDDEWKILQPKIEKVQTLQFQGRGGLGFGGRGGRGPGGGGDAATSRPSSPVQEKARDLQTVLDNKDAKPEEIKAKLQALRDTRTKAREELTKAQGELKEILTVRQEAVLVSMGMLE